MEKTRKTDEEKRRRRVLEIHKNLESEAEKKIREREVTVRETKAQKKKT